MGKNSPFTKQFYTKYTSKDFEIWERLYNRQYNNLNRNNKSVYEFFSGLYALGITNKIPKFSEVNKKLRKLNGWSIVAVKGLVDDGEFFSLLSEKKFPVTTWLRGEDNFDYIEEPDMFHDLFGHVPFLANSHYLRFLERMGDHGVKVFDTNDKKRQYKLSRLYWYTIEFGLIKSNNSYRAYGSGILSSYQETEKALSSDVEKKQFTYEILKEEFYKHDLQEFYVWVGKNIKFLNKIKIEEI